MNNGQVLDSRCFCSECTNCSTPKLYYAVSQPTKKIGQVRYTPLVQPLSSVSCPSAYLRGKHCNVSGTAALGVDTRGKGGGLQKKKQLQQKKTQTKPTKPNQTRQNTNLIRAYSRKLIQSVKNSYLNLQCSYQQR